MEATAQLLLCLLWSLVEVHSQTAPYLTFMGETLPPNACLDLSLVGDANDGSNSVQCHTDLTTCCSSEYGPDRGDWIPPGSDSRLPLSSTAVDIYEVRRIQRVDLHRRNNGDGSGIYRCAIETVAVNPDDNTDLSERATVSVGLYSGGCDIRVKGGLTLTVDSDLNGASPQFTLTCISTGGPTTVTWTRNSGSVVGDEVTVLDSATTAQYTHTLTVTGRLGGLYKCTLASSNPTSNTASFYIKVASAPTSLMAVQEGLTSIRVSWSPPTPLGHTTGYRIYYYNSGFSSGSVDISGGSTDNYLLTGLLNGAEYTVMIIGTSQHFPSEAVIYKVILAPVGAPENFQATAGERNVTFSWSAPRMSAPITSYNLSCSPSPSSLPRSFTLSGTYTLTGFYPETSYVCSLVAYNGLSAGPMTYVAFTTKEDYTQFREKLSGYIVCSQWVLYSLTGKLQDIRDGLIDELSDYCQCEVTDDNIDQERLSCSFLSKNSVTYSARINGTLDVASERLVSYLDSWISTGPTINVQGVLMRLGEICIKTVLDLSAGVCSLSHTTDPTDSNMITDKETSLIIGVTIPTGVVIVIGVSVTGICISKRRRNFMLQPLQVSSSPGPVPLLPLSDGNEET